MELQKAAGAQKGAQTQKAAGLQKIEREHKIGAGV